MPKHWGDIMVANINDITRVSLLYDFYGALLTEKQRSVMSLYHEENLSLSEIAEEYGISRQGVHDTLKKAEQALEEYERKLKLVDKLMRTEEAVFRLRDEFKTLEKIIADNREAMEHLYTIENIIKTLED